MKAIANEFGAFNIRVNTVHPSSVDTPMIQNEPNWRLFRPDLEDLDGYLGGIRDDEACREKCDGAGGRCGRR
jgi:NAD(P)-dependent dehydrogenase (short-subunit alcohol dehydrogenase family)